LVTPSQQGLFLRLAVNDCPAVLGHVLGAGESELVASRDARDFRVVKSSENSLCQKSWQAEAQCHVVFPKLVHGVGRTPGRTPWSAANALVGLLVRISMISLAEERVQGDPRGPGGPPHFLSDKSQHWEN